MLKKLMKYEIKATARIFLPLIIMLFACAFITRILRLLPQADFSRFNIQSIAYLISMLIYIILFAGIVAGTLIIMIQRFYKNLLGDSGYLMFTLPVKTWQHIFSKLLVAMMWTVLNMLAAVITIFIIAADESLITVLAKGWKPFINSFLGADLPMNLLISVEIIVIGILCLAAAILQIYAAIALGHMFNKHKLLLSFVMYIILNTILQVAVTIIAVILGGSLNNLPSTLSVNVVAQLIMILIIAICALFTVGYYALTNYLLKNKLNLE